MSNEQEATLHIGKRTIVIEFGDALCPYCGAVNHWEGESFKLLGNYPECEGCKTRFILRPEETRT
jgi:hypothetical protein